MRYNTDGRDIHLWLDQPSQHYAGAHREFRHDTETVRIVGELFGSKYGKAVAENIALDHIMADHEEDIRKRHEGDKVNSEDKFETLWEKQDRFYQEEIKKGRELALQGNDFTPFEKEQLRRRWNMK
jgi:hypothetical protein